MSKLKISTDAKIEQRVKELLYPKVEAGKIYYFKSPHGRVERSVIQVNGKMILYRKPNGFGTCPMLTFQRLYKQYGVMDS